MYIIILNSRYYIAFLRCRVSGVIFLEINARPLNFGCIFIFIFRSGWKIVTCANHEPSVATDCRTRAYFRWRNNKNKIKTLVFLGSRKSIAIKRHNGGDEKNNNDYNKSRLPHALQQAGTKIIRNKRKKLVNNKEMFTQQCNPENKFLLLMLSYVLYTYII